MTHPRRKFLRQSVTAGAGLFLLPGLISSCTSTSSEEGDNTESNDQGPSGPQLFFDISLAQWSLHKTFFAGELDALDFPQVTREKFDISAVEYVNQFFKDKAEDTEWLGQLKQRCDDNGVHSLLIMCDGEGNLGDTDDTARKTAVTNHYKWVDAAAFLGCHSIRVNAAGQGTAEEVSAAAIDGLGQLCEYGAKSNINVIVENHGSYSSNAEWLSSVIAQVGMDNCGTLPDFGNFCIQRSEDGCAEEYDRYVGVRELMRYAKGVSAKTHDFGPDGSEIHTDYKQMLTIVKEAGYSGFIGIEYEGSEMGEYEGIQATKDLLVSVGEELS